MHQMSGTSRTRLANVSKNGGCHPVNTRSDVRSDVTVTAGEGVRVISALLTRSRPNSPPVHPSLSVSLVWPP